jgi:hypothetical protein
MTTTTINLRSTKLISDYVRTVDTMRTLAKKLSELSKLEERMRPAVLDAIGERAEKEIRKQIRILEPSVKESIGQIDGQKTVEEFKAIGLPVTTRSPEFVPPATFKALVLKGAVPEHLVKRETETLIIVH